MNAVAFVSGVIIVDLVNYDDDVVDVDDVDDDDDDDDDADDGDDDDDDADDDDDDDDDDDADADADDDSDDDDDDYITISVIWQVHHVIQSDHSPVNTSVRSAIQGNIDDAGNGGKWTTVPG